MQERSKLDQSNPEFMPLHRSKSFRVEERIKMKFVNRYNWCTDVDIKDPFRNKWRKKIKRKGDKLNNLHMKKKCEEKSREKKDVLNAATTMHVPSMTQLNVPKRG